MTKASLKHVQGEDLEMSLELIKEAVKANQIIGEDLTQAVVEHDIIVPDIKPDIQRILMLDGDVFVDSREVMQDEVRVSGSVNYKILYVPDDIEQGIKSINAKAGFSCALSIPEAKPGMKCKAKCGIEHIEHNILNGRKVSIRTIIGVSGRVTNEVEQELTNDLSGLDDIQVQKESAKIYSYIGENEESYGLSDALEVPAGKPSIREILRSDVKISGKEYKITDNKIAAKGEIYVSTLYTGDTEDGAIQYMEHEIPFTQFIDLPDANEDSLCEVEYRIADAQFEVGEDSDGENRILNSQVKLDIGVSGYNKRYVEVLSDAYSTRSLISIDKEQFRMEEVISENKSQVILKDTIMIQEGNPDISEVFNVLCKPGISDCRISDERLTVEGVVENNILYLASDQEQPVFCSSQEVPFKYGVDIKGLNEGMRCDIDVDVEHCNYSVVSSNEVEVRLVVSLSIKAVNQFMVPIVARATEQPIDIESMGSRPSITVYFTQPGDTLWKIAKRYLTTSENIRAINKLSEDDMIQPGQQIIIPKKYYGA